MHPPRALRLAQAMLLVLWLLGAAGTALAQTRVPELKPAPDLSLLSGRPLTRVEVVVQGKRWLGRRPSVRAEVGQVLSPELVRRSLDELLESGGFGDARAEVDADGDGVRLRILVTPRRVIADVRVTGGVLADDVLLRAVGLQVGRELTSDDLEHLQARLREEHAKRGFPSARATLLAIDTDDPLRVALRIDLMPGPPKRIDLRKFYAWPDPNEPVLHSLLGEYQMNRGDRADEEQLEAADRKFEALLRVRGFHRATVEHALENDARGKLTLKVNVRADQRMRISFEGNRLFDSDELLSALSLDETDDRAPESLAEKLRQHYLMRGRLDVQVTPHIRTKAGSPVSDLVFTLREGEPLRVTARRYPCLTRFKPSAVDAEIDSFLAELPGAELLGPVDPRVSEPVYGPTHDAAARHAPRDFNPYASYVPDVYEKAIDHLRDLYRSEGYLSASVGPLSLVRRACDRRSPVGQCLPESHQPALPAAACSYDELGLPLELPPLDSALSCVPDPKRGKHCSNEASLYLPIRLGPRTYLYDVSFEGNSALVESRLFEASELSLNVPLSQAELDRARRRILDTYAEDGFAFADAEVELDLSPDHTRGRARFVVSEREQVRVSRVVIKGADATSERLIRSRIALETGGIYRRSLVRRTEERLATLGVFGSVSVGFEDPYVPAREKVVIVSVEERLAQYVDVRPGLSSGEGFRISFEYGHRNLAGEAIQLTLRSQLNFLPQQFIIEEDVRAKHEAVETRFGRHNSASVEFPEIGLGPLFRFNVEAIDVRDNARDYSLVKDAFIPTVIFRPERRLSAQLGASLELNTATILGDTGGLVKYIKDSGQLTTFRVPEGTTFVTAQRASATWDQRDVPLDATRGFLISGSIEHVHAKPVGDTATAAATSSGTGPFDPVVSDFMQYTSRVAGYIPITKHGMALALSFRWGLNSQLIERSHTYPDRLFFMGGVDTIRGFTQDSLIPEDIAQQLLDARDLAASDPGDNELLTVDRILIRGGDVFVNPRAELRIPISGSVQTALFLDTGNLWSSIRAFQDLRFRLRYSAGSGIRIATPVGPLVFDYGFNLERLLDQLDPSRKRQRFWESIGAFHFSIGLF